MENLSPNSTSATSEQDYNSSKHNEVLILGSRTSTNSQQVTPPNLPSQVDHRAQKRAQHLRLVHGLPVGSNDSSDVEAQVQDIASAPLFSTRVQYALEDGELCVSDSPATNVLSQYGFLGIREATYGLAGIQDRLPEEGVRDQDFVYANMNAPWSAFICGSQGSGKSHTLSCLLENSLLASVANVLPNPLAGIVFHYDKFTSFSSMQLCEAAYLCSQNIPVRVLVSPSNFKAMEKAYSNLPGMPQRLPKPQVSPLYLQQQDLNVTNMMTLMAINETSGNPLYLGVIYQTLRDMAAENQSGHGINYQDFKHRLKQQDFTKAQQAPLDMRLQLLEAFLDVPSSTRSVRRARTEKIWKFEKGSLTIIDMSCPFINENDACALFAICLGRFMGNRQECGRVIALDEAHKFLTQSGEAMKFTDQLTSIICQQRHLATRVLIATQEPTLSPRLLDLCNVTIVHRFLSPAWFEILKSHLAGVRDIRHSKEGKSARPDDIFHSIVSLKTGQALVFSPTGMLDVCDTGALSPQPHLEAQALQDAYIKIRVRKRITTDGGKSIMASDKAIVVKA